MANITFCILPNFFCIVEGLKMNIAIIKDDGHYVKMTSTRSIHSIDDLLDLYLWNVLMFCSFDCEKWGILHRQNKCRIHRRVVCKNRWGSNPMQKEPFLLYIPGKVKTLHLQFYFFFYSKFNKIT